MCPGGEDKLVLYTTSLQVVPKTFEDCNKVRTAIKEVGFVMFERDVSTKKFSGEFRELMGDKGVVLPTPVVFVKGRCVGGFEEVLRFQEAGTLGKMLRGLGLPQKIDGTSGSVCEGCGEAIPECRNCKGGTKKVKLQLVGGGTANYSCHGCRGTGLEHCSTCTYVADPSVSS